LAIGAAELHQSKFEILKSKFLLLAGFPLASVASHPAMETQGPTARFKTRSEGGNKAQNRQVASAALAITVQASLPLSFICRNGGKTFI